MLSQRVVKITGELAHLESLMAPHFKNICAPLPLVDHNSEADMDFPAWVLRQVPALHPRRFSCLLKPFPLHFWRWWLQG